VTLQTSGVTIHVRFQLRVMCPALQARLVRGIEMHLKTAEAGKFAATKTRRGRRAVVFAPSHANHAIAPESILEKIRFGFANEIFLFGVISCIRLHDKTLNEIICSRAKTGAVSVEINLVRHVVESPDAVTLATGEGG